MKVECRWNDGMRFSATSGDHVIAMDAKRPIGTDTAMTPKELVLAGLCGCTAMDVASLMKKHRQIMASFHVIAEADAKEGVHPIVFERVRLSFLVSGDVDPAKLIEAVTLSQTKYCGVTAMLIKAVPIDYEIALNRAIIHSGSARFD